MKSIIFITMVSLLSLLSLSGCGDSRNRALDRSGMGDPLRTDTTPIKVAIGAMRYIIPANCFSSPLEDGKVLDGFLNQDTILITVLWPTGECRTQKNDFYFHTNGFGKRVSILVSRYVGSEREVLTIKTISSIINSGRIAGDYNRVPPPDREDGQEDVWITHKEFGDTYSPREVSSDRGRTYVAYCSQDNSAEAKRTGCSMQIIRANHVKAVFSPQLNNSNVAMRDFLTKKLSTLSVSKEF